mmetsp:Transcript_12532/g.35204  ORF Transcript_12532/g.35204 Transcript_12532/m.35204 type:complete len:969 (-) Transcript_12532:69-2975(-)
MTTSRPGSARPQRPTTPNTPGSEAGSDVGQQDMSSDDSVRVCVRFRPLTPSEVARHEQEVWAQVDDHHVGVVGRFGITSKYAFDKVFGPETLNSVVYQQMVEDLVDSISQGIDSTIFAYGVTSSGKTHTMHGTPEEPGVVTSCLQQLFASIYADRGRDYMIRLSYVEIYNEVINDLLDPVRQNLKVVEDPLRGQVVEGARQEPVVTAEDALALVARGEVHRKVSATGANAGSSRSHTFVRISVESTGTVPECDDGESGSGAITRRMSSLNLIDLAGSEAAKVQRSKAQSREGSYINKSLLALGTVIAKLGDPNSVHIPFRDSKLTRLLASSLSGSGARTCVICTVTPAGSQAEETHNTLKFATRAKMVSVRVVRHEHNNMRELLMRYQQEVGDLRQQLFVLQKSHGLDSGQMASLAAQVQQHRHKEEQDEESPDRRGMDIATLEEVLSLREQLEEERAVRVMYEQEREELHAKVARLSRLAMRSSGDHSRARSSIDQGQVLVETEVWRAEQSLGLATEEDGAERQESKPESGTRGAMTPENGVDGSVSEEHSHDYGEIVLNMREQMMRLTDELQERDRQIMELRSKSESILADASGMVLEAEREQMDLPQEVDDMEREQAQKELELEILHADREALEQQLQQTLEENHRLQRARANEAEALHRLKLMERHVQQVLADLADKEQQLVEERQTLFRFQELSNQVEQQLRGTTEENQEMRTELGRLEAQNNHLQGYLLDGMSAKELSQLIRNLTQAVERVRVTVQMRRLVSPSPQPEESPRAAAEAAPASPLTPAPALKSSSGDGGSASAIKPSGSPKTPPTSPQPEDSPADSPPLTREEMAWRMAASAWQTTTDTSSSPTGQSGGSGSGLQGGEEAWRAGGHGISRGPAAGAGMHPRHASNTSGGSPVKDAVAEELSKLHKVIPLRRPMKYSYSPVEAGVSSTVSDRRDRAAPRGPAPPPSVPFAKPPSL